MDDLPRNNNNNNKMSSADNADDINKSSPQIVENTLKEFYDYLKSLKERLQLQQQQEQQQQHQHREATDAGIAGTCTTAASDDDTFGDYSLRRNGHFQQPQPHDNNNDNEQVPLTWTERHTQQYLKNLERFQKVLVEQIDRFPLHSQAGRDILEAVQSAATRGAGSLLQGPNSYKNTDDHDKLHNKLTNQSNHVAAVLRHVSQMVIYVSRLLQEIQLVDLDKLIYFMQHNQRAGDVMAGKDVILLCGAARSGKTTTMHYMAGSKLEEIEVDGFFHLQPSAVRKADMAHCKTSANDRDPVTNHLQTTEVTFGENMQHSVVICDTPGLGNDFSSSLNAGSVELDIANGLGMIRAIHRARTVKPVFVINREEVRVRERFSALDGDTVACIARLVAKNSEIDLGPLNYVFTKYEEKHRDCLCKQFTVMKHYHKKNMNTGKYNPTNEDGTASTGTRITTKDGKFMKRVLDDIVKKTTPSANIVLPLKEDPVDFLEKLWKEARTVIDPQRFFVPFVSFPALKKLQLQLRITLSDLRTSLVEEDQSTAVYRLRQLQNLAQVLPEARDCAKLGTEAIQKHMTSLRTRVMASIERKDYSMAIHRAQQLVRLSEVIPEAKTYGTVTHDAVVMLRDLIHALQSNDYKTCQDRMTKLTELAREFPEANKCAHFALKASIQHVTEFRERVIKTLDNIIHESKDVTHFTSMLKKMQTEMNNVVTSEPLLLSCVNEDFSGLEKQDVRAMQQVSQCTSEAFCIDQVQRLTDHLKKDLPDFKAKTLDMDDLLKRKDAFLASLEKLKIVSVELRQSPAGARAESIYHLAFKNFHDLVSSVITDAENKYKSAWTDLDVFGRKVWFVALLLQGPLKNKPHTARREHTKIEDLERRVLKVMLRLEIEVKRAMDRLKNFKFPECTKVVLKQSAIPDFGFSELKAPRFLLISVAKSPRIQKLLPSKVDVLEINVCIAMFDHALLNFWKKVVIRLEQDYAVIVAMQKVQKDPQEILKIAKLLRADIGRVEKEFLEVCGWSDDITTESESDLKRLIAVRDCVQAGVVKLEEMSTTRGQAMNFFYCGGNALSHVAEGAAPSYICRAKAAPE